MKTPIPKKQKTIIGRSEYIDLPDWGIRGILARTDSGARSSALHVEGLQELAKDQVSFYVVVKTSPRKKRVAITAKVVKWARVRSSSGHYTRRCFVEARAKIGPVEKTILVSLTCRKDMDYRMLLGREALRKDFLIDVSKQHAFGKHTP